MKANTDNWPGFRGRQGSGLSGKVAVPGSWDDSGKGNRFRTPISGLGHSSPVIWDNRLFVTSSQGLSGDSVRAGLYGDIAPVNDNSVHTWRVWCLDKVTGTILWSQTACVGVPKIARHPKSSQASATVATNGRVVVAFFGSEGLYCYSVTGKLLWKRDFGILDSGFFQSVTSQWGWASSPVIGGNKVFIQCDVQRGSFIAALDLSTGRDVWRTPRADVPTWSTPLYYEKGSFRCVVVNGYRHIGGYDANTGAELWRLEGGGDIPVPTPVISGSHVVITNAHGGKSPIYVVSLQARGTVNQAASKQPMDRVLWSLERGGSYMQTPIVVDGLLYVCSDAGILGCYKAATGQRLYQERIGSGRTGYSASAVHNSGRLFYTSEDGEVSVVKAGPVFEVLSRNNLAGMCMATPAISNGVLYFHTVDAILGIG